MKVTVTEVFIDKYTGQEYRIGDVIDIPDAARVSDMVERKLVHVAEEIVKEKKPATKKKKDDEKCLKK